MGRYLKSGMGWMWILPFLFGCAAGPHPAPEALLCPHPAQEAVLWVQTAAENRAGAIQSYAAAERMLDAALADASWTAALEQTEEYEKLPPAVILDVDETVLDNSPFNARLVRENRSFDPALWADWVGREAAEPIPAAREFIQTATDKGIAVFYITN
ncbi:MAG: HAD family acid phosphatase, partial [Thermodesulfobacteriota bacterium]